MPAYSDAVNLITCIQVNYLAEGSSSDQRELKRSEKRMFEDERAETQAFISPHQIQNRCDSQKKKKKKQLEKWVDMKVQDARALVFMPLL